jgi:hypothetical protein
MAGRVEIEEILFKSIMNASTVILFNLLRSKIQWMLKRSKDDMPLGFVNFVNKIKSFKILNAAEVDFSPFSKISKSK